MHDAPSVPPDRDEAWRSGRSEDGAPRPRPQAPSHVEPGPARGEAPAGLRPASAADLRWMRAALDAARIARDLDEVPIGAVVVHGGEVLATGYNLTRTRQDPTAHAELLAVQRATALTGYQRLLGAVVYSTVEPCFMCAGALVHARVERVVWATRDPKFGGCASLGRVLDDPRLNHRAHWTEGVLADEARDLLLTFFHTKRREARLGRTRP